MSAPHCDQNVLHAPGECEICDEHAADAQRQRIKDGVNFTGHHDPNKKPCPAWAARGPNCQAWGGNTPKKTVPCKSCGKPTMFHNPCLDCAFDALDLETRD